MKFTQKSLVGLLAILIAASAVGCSNTGHAFNEVTVPLGPDSSEFTAASTTGPGSNPAYSCPSSNNVIPTYDWDFPATTNYYTACTVSATPGAFEIYGLPTGTTVACVFPLVYTNGATDPIQFYRDPAQGDADDPASDIVDYCFTAGASGALVPSFGVQMNAMIIVAGTDEDAMKECMNGTEPLESVTSSEDILDSGEYAAWDLCPHYSFGQT